MMRIIRFTFRTITKNQFPFNKKVRKTLAKSVLTPLELTSAKLETDTSIQKKLFGSGTTILVILNEEIDDIVKIFKYLEESGLLIKVVSERVHNAAEEQRGVFLGMLIVNCWFLSNWRSRLRHDQGRLMHNQSR